MTLDVLSFIDTKGGNAAEIRESQRKRGASVELVDEVIQMYDDWVKRTVLILSIRRNLILLSHWSGLRGEQDKQRD